MTSSQVHPPLPLSGRSTLERKAKVLTWLEPYLPVLPLLFLGYLFLAADFLPSISAGQSGLLWLECRLAGETYQQIPNDLQVGRCFGDAAPSLASGASLLTPQPAAHPPLVRLVHSYSIQGKVVSIGKLGLKYFLVVDGKKVGPTFDNIWLDPSPEGEGFSVAFGQGQYVFRGVRGGIYYLVEIKGES